MTMAAAANTVVIDADSAPAAALWRGSGSAAMARGLRQRVGGDTVREIETDKPGGDGVGRVDG
jgi:hypothetical protein